MTEKKNKEFWKDKEFLAEIAANIAGESVRTSMEYAEKRQTTNEKGKPLVKDKDYWAELGGKLAQVSSKIVGQYLKKYLRELEEKE